MDYINWGALIFAAIAGSLAMLVTMYVLMPALGLPILDFASVTGGWVGATGRHSGRIGVAIFMLVSALASSTFREGCTDVPISDDRNVCFVLPIQ